MNRSETQVLSTKKHQNMGNTPRQHKAPWPSSSSSRSSSSSSSSRSSSSSSRSRHQAPRALKVFPFPSAYMASRLTPSKHLLIRARKMLIEQLYFEKVSPWAVAEVDAVACGLWTDVTLDAYMGELQDVLPADSFRELLGFCDREYPLLYCIDPYRAVSQVGLHQLHVFSTTPNQSHEAASTGPSNAAPFSGGTSFRPSRSQAPGGAARCTALLAVKARQPPEGPKNQAHTGK